MNRGDLQSLADVRINEAQALLNSVPPLSDGAYYLAGYAVECALKAAIAKLNNQHDWPEKSFVSDCHSHNLSQLLRLARLDQIFVSDSAVNHTLARNWAIVKDWNERSRYERHSLADAQKIIEAVIDSTSHGANGVLPWIKVHW